VAGNKVLIVEDSSATRDYYRMYLQQRGYAVTEAYNGLEALEKLSGESFAAAIVDINMPKMDGYQFIRELRNSEADCVTPIAVVSSESKSSDRQVAYQAGANAYLVKPVTPEQLQSVIELFGAVPEEVSS
jgi:two-component system chemotaxis response regulator CheY